MSWKDMFEKQHDGYSGAADVADSVALIIICALLLFVVFM